MDEPIKTAEALIRGYIERRARAVVANLTALPTDAEHLTGLLAGFAERMVNDATPQFIAGLRHEVKPATDVRLHVRSVGLSARDAFDFVTLALTEAGERHEDFAPDAVEVATADGSMLAVKTL